MRLAALLASIALAFSANTGHAAGSDESEVKAAFVFNLLRYTQWPNDVLPEKELLRICHLGLSLPQEKALAKLEAKSVSGHPVRLQAVRSLRGSHNCHAVVFGPYAAVSALQEIQGYGVLTIGEEGFVDHGGMIGLVTENDRVTLEFNLDSIRRAQLRIPAQVLNLGRRVIGK